MYSCLTTTVAIAALAAGSASATEILDYPYVHDEIIVSFAGSPSESVVHDVADRVGVTLERTHPPRSLALVSVPEGRDFMATLDALERDPLVVSAMPNYTGTGGEILPGDTYFDEQWHLDNTGQSGGEADADIDATEGWEITRGSGDVVVAVLDSGIELDHPEFAGRIVAGFDFVDTDPNPNDLHGHGTHVAGLLAADADNDFGVAGVDHGCSLMPVRVLDENLIGTTFSLIQALDYVASRDVDVVNMSLINYPNVTALEDALAGARDNGAILVACGGNDGIGGADDTWPGASPHTISVGWTRDDDWRSGSSATGASLDVVAPGNSVITVAYGSEVDDRDLFSGCSAATPIVSGIAALARALDPAMTHDVFRTFLIAGAEDEVGSPAQDLPGRDDYYGYGRVNLNTTLVYVTTVAAPDVATAGAAVTRAVPNPFRASTMLVPPGGDTADVRVELFSVGGRHVRTLTGTGSAGIVWDGRDAVGLVAPPGIYYTRVTTGGASVPGTVVRLR